MSFDILVLLCLWAVSFAFEPVSVDTKAGQFNGLRRDFEAFGEPRYVDKYLGIPYAEPPTGDRRWQKPEPKAVLTEPYDATTFGSACLPLEMPMGGVRKSTLTISFSEDCLFLNVYAPSASKQRLPVMVYFHGGGFNVGASDIYVADTFSTVGNVIFVSVNYRLNIWGFLSTGDNNIPGNFGLWDQQLALQWVHDNIAAFGGDPRRVTVSGHSCGASSAILHGMYPSNKGLFQRVFAIAGSTTCPWAFNPDPLPTTREFAELAGCTNTEDTKQIAECLRSIPSEDLYAVLNKAEHAFIKYPLDFISVVDNDYIKGLPEDILSGTVEPALSGSELFASLDFMTGTNDMEGMLNLSPWAGTPDFEDFTVTRESFEHVLIPEAIRIMYGDNVPAIIQELFIFQYTDWSDPNDPVKARQKWLEMTTDYSFKTHIDTVIKLHAKMSNMNTYLYNLDAFPSRHVLPTPTWASKPNHGDELTFLFGYDEGYMQWMMPYSDNYTPPQWEYDLSKAFMLMIANFVASGNPNEPVDINYFTTTRWPAFTLEHQLAFNISREMSADSVTMGLYGRATHFWNTLIPSVIKAYRHAHSPSSLFVPRDDQSCDTDGSCNP